MAATRSSTAILFATLFLAILFTPATSDINFTTEVVGYFPQHPHMDIDSSANAHFCYGTIITLPGDLFGEDLRYCTKSGGVWVEEIVDNATSGLVFVGDNCRIAVDALDSPHIVYEDDEDYLVEYAYKDGGVWHRETAGSIGAGDSHPSIAIDGTNTPHISYYSYIGAHGPYIKYAVKTGSSWSVFTVDNEGKDTSIALDANDEPYIGHMGNSGPGLYTYPDPVAAASVTPPTLTLRQYPNPFNPTTTIAFTLGAAATVDLSIFDSRGVEVVALLSGELPAGAKSLVSNGRNAAGERVATGVYHARLRAGTELVTHKLVLIK